MDLPKRKPLRLPDYDYSAPGAYFVTICTHERRCILSDIAVGADAHANTHKRVLKQKRLGSCLTGLEEHLQGKAE